MGLLAWVFEAVVSMLIVLALIPVFIEMGSKLDILQLLWQVLRLLFS